MMKFVNWKSIVSKQVTLAPLVEDFLKSGHTNSCRSMDILRAPHDIPNLEDKDSFAAMSQFGFEVCREWSQERSRLLSPAAFISRPVLVMTDDWLSLDEESLPYLRVVFSKRQDRYDSSLLSGFLPTEQIPAAIKSLAFHDFVPFKSSEGDGSYEFWLANDIARSLDSLIPFYVELSEEERHDFLDRFLNNILSYFSDFLKQKNEAAVKKSIDLNEIAVHVSNHIVEKRGEAGNARNAGEFIKEIVAMTGYYQCQQEICLASEWLIWAHARNANAI